MGEGFLQTAPQRTFKTLMMAKAKRRRAYRAESALTKGGFPDSSSAENSKTLWAGTQRQYKHRILRSGYPGRPKAPPPGPPGKSGRWSRGAGSGRRSEHARRAGGSREEAVRPRVLHAETVLWSSPRHVTARVRPPRRAPPRRDSALCAGSEVEINPGEAGQVGSVVLHSCLRGCCC